MSAALDLLDQFRAIGAEIVNRDGRLILRSESPIPPAMIAAAKLAKPELIAVIGGREQAPTPEPIIQTSAAPISEPRVEPFLLSDGRRIWRFRAQSIPEILNNDDIRPAVEARWCGCVLVADGLELILVEPWLSELPDKVRDGLAANAGTVIALLRGETQVRTREAAPNV